MCKTQQIVLKERDPPENKESVERRSDEYSVGRRVRRGQLPLHRMHVCLPGLAPAQLSFGFRCQTTKSDRCHSVFCSQILKLYRAEKWQ